MAQEPGSQQGATEPIVPMRASDSSDQQLVGAILRNDRKAAAQFVAQHADAIYGYVRHRLAPRHDLVADMVQDVFLAALESLPNFRFTSPLRAWVLGIARHKVEDFYRRQLRAPGGLDEQDEPVLDAPLPDETIDRERAGVKAQQVLQQLSENYRFVLLWRYWDDRGVREIAQATGKTEKSIERMLARARARFRALWEQP